jgi:hypothetical protein
MKSFFRRTITPALILSCVLLAHAQTQTEPILGDGANNEDSKSILDLIAQRAGDEKLVIMIARHGDGESPRINRRRLGTASNYLQNTRAIPKARLVTAEGTRVRGRGKLEIYLDGKLLVVFTFRPNRDFAREG